MYRIVFLVIAMGLARLGVGRDLSIDESNVDFGERYQFAEVVKDIKVWNTSDHAVEHVSVRKLIGVGEATIEPSTIPPKDFARLHIRMPLEQSIGSVGTRFLVEAKENGRSERYAVHIGGFVESVMAEPVAEADLGVVREGETHKATEIKLTGAESSDIVATKILSAPPFVKVVLADSGRSVMIQPIDSSTLGQNSGIVKLAINSDKQKETWIRVGVDLRGSIAPDQNPIDFNLQRPSHLSAARLQFRSLDGKEFKLGNPQAGSSLHADIRPVPCPESKSRCAAYEVMLRKDQPMGQIFGQIVFPITGTEKKIAVSTAGLMLDDATEVQPLEKMLKNDDSQGGSSRAGASKSIADSLQQATHPEQKTQQDDVPLVLPGSGPLLKWQVGNESAIYGYVIYRSTSAEGTFARVNDEIVRSKNRGDNVTSTYQYRDNTAQSGKEYWYYITIFYNSGKKVQLTGPQKVVAK